MDTMKQAVSVLIDAERRFRALVAAAAATDEYDVIQRITDLARHLGTLVQEAQQGESTVAVTDTRAEPQTPIGAGSSRTASDGKHSRVRERVGQQFGSAVSQRAQRSPIKGTYPKFSKRADHLVKIGWSKKVRNEYEHKAPRRVVDALATAIVRRTTKGKLFTAEGLFPLKDPRDQSEIPSYQAYVALAWFKHVGSVSQHGRRGYSVNSPSRLEADVLESWNQLPERGA